MPSDHPWLVEAELDRDTTCRTVGGSFQCGLCRQGFRESMLLQAHVRHHFLTKPFQCGHCAAGFDTCHQLTLHVDSLHSTSQQSDKSTLSSDLHWSKLPNGDIEKPDPQTVLNNQTHSGSISLSLPSAEFPDSSNVKEEQQIKYDKTLVPCSGLDYIRSYSSEQKAADGLTTKSQLNCSCIVSPVDRDKHTCRKLIKSCKTTSEVDHCLSKQSRENESSGEDTQDVHFFDKSTTERDCQWHENVPANNFSFSRAETGHAKMTDISDAAANLDGITSLQSTRNLSSTSSIPCSSTLSRTGPSTSALNFSNCITLFCNEIKLEDSIKTDNPFSSPKKNLTMGPRANQCTSYTKTALLQVLNVKLEEAPPLGFNSLPNFGSEVDNALPVHFESFTKELAEVSPMQSHQSAIVSKEQLGQKSKEVKGCKIHCPHCQLLFSSKPNLNNHIRTVHTISKCPICEKILVNKQTLRKHIVSEHPNEKPFKCEVCSATFMEKRYLKHHVMVRHPDETPFKCQKCPASFILGRYLKYHIAYKHSDERPFKCEACSASFKKQCQLKYHMNIKHMEKKPLKCSMCPATFIKECYLKRHASFTHGDVTEKECKCEECPASFTEQSSLKRHMANVHNSLNPIVCPLCPGRLNNTKSLNWHLEKHHKICTIHKVENCKCKAAGAIESLHKWKSDENIRTLNNEQQTDKTDENAPLKQSSEIDSFICPVCNKQLRRRQTLLYHIRVHHSYLSEWRPFCCQRCAATFKTKGALFAHDKFVHNKNYKSKLCHICGCSFKHDSSLRAHQASKHGLNIDNPAPQRVECSICQATFSHKFKLKRHMMSHSGEKPFTCEVCGQGFSRSTFLGYHLNSHFNSKPIKCSQCGKGFNSHSALRLHNFQRHCAEKKFVCNQCGKRFQLPSNLKRHELTHTDLRPYPCPHCSKTFRCKSARQYHLRVNHEANKSEIVDSSTVKDILRQNTIPSA